ncbi:hypothetical protein [Kordiimonas aquimaris]|uniref:hypothetical protein n=1 Tax=Kordiimonas aquimaris TaxID=707591 RepID=UPI0021D19DFB|nr:hypothetical protein [Kordiimonas aquimaris]
MKLSAKRYMRDTIVSFSLYGLILFAVNTYLYAYDADGWLPVALAFLPMLPILYFARAIIIFSRTWDELQKQIAFEATVVALFVVGLGTFSYGFLEGVGFPVLQTIWIMPLLIAVQGLAQFIIARRYA